jgi:hypothetical protein
VSERDTALAKILSDLDRCEHGRHEGDICSGTRGCNGPSRGDPIIRTGDIMGFTMYGQSIVMPPREKRYDPEAWTRKDLHES